MLLDNFYISSLQWKCHFGLCSKPDIDHYYTTSWIFMSLFIEILDIPFKTFIKVEIMYDKL